VIQPDICRRPEGQEAVIEMETDLPPPARVTLKDSRFLQIFDSDPEVLVVGEGPEMDHPILVCIHAGEEQEA
jgi:hypothetical protein